MLKMDKKVSSKPTRFYLLINKISMRKILWVFNFGQSAPLPSIQWRFIM